MPVSRPRPSRESTIPYLAGRPADVSAVRNLLRAGYPGRLLNMYGPTEATTFATYGTRHPRFRPAHDSVPIGGPISNTQIFILDECMRPTPVGVTGEIYIGGPGLALGYLDSPDLTAQRFVAHPFQRASRANAFIEPVIEAAGGREGTVEYQGRLDQRQVKNPRLSH